MRTVQLREARAQFSSLVDAADKGEPTIVTRYGREAAMLVPIEVARQVYPKDEPNLIEYLMTMPVEIPNRRNPSKSRKVRF
jgi:antitoxin Phd